MVRAQVPNDMQVESSRTSLPGKRADNGRAGSLDVPSGTLP
jgi:hypothetical protein